MFWLIVGLAILFFIDFLSSAGARESPRPTAHQKEKRKDFDDEKQAAREARLEELKRRTKEREFTRQENAKNEWGCNEVNYKKGIDGAEQSYISKDPAELLLARKITDRINRVIKSKHVALTVVLRQLDISKNAGD